MKKSPKIESQPKSLKLSKETFMILASSELLEVLGEGATSRGEWNSACCIW